MSSRKYNSLELANFFISSYNTATQSSIKPELNAKMHINMHLHRYKSLYNIQPHQICAAIQFAYLHNPIKADSLRVYGSISQMGRVIPLYLQWELTNKEIIEKEGLANALLMTTNKIDVCDVDESELLAAALMSISGG